MKKNILLIIFIMSMAKVFSQHATFRLIEYVPAPGQHINIENLGTPQAAEKIRENVSSAVSLGSFGGYVVLGFEEGCINHEDNPYGIDFTVFGNAFSGSSEPGIIWVMKDINKNGIPDDTWYEIAGSNYFNSGTRFNYEVTYYKTGTRDVIWKDNDGKTGMLQANNFNLQEYYPKYEFFPQYPADSVSFSGTLLSDVIDDVTAGEIRILPPVFGYADTHPWKQGIDLSLADNPYTSQVEGAGGSPIDISWAVDAEGKYLELDTIHFIKIVSASLATAGWLGEISTDVAWVQKTGPDRTITGKETRLVVYDPPKKILADSFHQIEAHFFLKGRKQEVEMEYKSSSEETAIIDSEGKLTALKQGTARVSITAGGETEYFDIHVVTADSILFLSSFSPVYPGDSVQLMVKVLDNEGGVLDVPVKFDSSDSMVGGIIEKGEEHFFTALQPGETWLSASVPGFEAKTMVLMKVLSPEDKIRVIFSVKKEDENIFPLQWIEVGPANINSMVENRQKDYSVYNRVSVAHVIAAGLAKAGADFDFRDDEAGGGTLYLHKLEKDGIFTYGWGGKTQPAAYARGWVISRNTGHFINDFDNLEVAEGDTIVLYHEGNIQDQWVFTRLVPDAFNAGPGDVIQVLMEETVCNLLDGNIIAGISTPVADAEVFAGETYFTGANGKTEVYAGNSFPFTISSGSDAVVISAGVQTAADSHKNPLWQVYPNPADGEIFISAGGTLINQESRVPGRFADSGISLIVFDIRGNIILEKAHLDFPHKLMVCMLPVGIYHLVLYTKNHVETHKVIKR